MLQDGFLFPGPLGSAMTSVVHSTGVRDGAWEMLPSPTMPYNTEVRVPGKLCL